MKVIGAVIVAFIAILPAAAQTPVVTTTTSGSTVAAYDVYEITMNHDSTYTYPNDNVTITAVFTSPTGVVFNINGFFYDNFIWKARFAPNEVGSWTWTLSFANSTGTYNTSGSFTCTASASSGFIKISTQNVRRFITQGDGKPFFVNGVQLGGVSTFNASPMTGYTDANKPTQFQPEAQFMSMYRRSGINIWRNNWQNADPAPFLTALNSSLTGFNLYNITEGKRVDEYTMDVHQSGLKYMMTISVGPLISGYSLTGTNASAALTDYVRQFINRWGAYVDIWEIGNEISGVPQNYLDVITAAFHTYDPYNHPLTNSYQAPTLNESGLTCANTHTYRGSSITTLDHDWMYSGNSLLTGYGLWYGQTFNGVYVASMRELYPNKPIFSGECGNAAPVGNYSPERYRIPMWTTICNESGVIYWLQNFSKTYNPTGGYSNMYVGEEERGEARVLMNQTRDLDINLASTIPANGAVTCSPSAGIHGYTMASSTNIIGYFLQTTTHASTLSGATVTIPVPANGMIGQWIDPGSGNILQTFTVNSGTQTLNVPAFMSDISLRIRPATTAPIIEFQTADYLTREDAGSVTITVNRENNSSGAVSVSYATSDGSAIAGTNYTARSGTLAWTDGDMSPKTITVPLQDNVLAESDKDIQVFLSNPTGGAQLGGNDNTLLGVQDATDFGRPGITSALSVTGTTNAPFSYTITATNTPTSFYATGLPTGLILDASTGIISGTTSFVGTATVVLSATNATSSGSATLTMTFAAVPVITSPLTDSGVSTQAFNYTIAANNVPTSFTATGLPLGLSINTTTGVITGNLAAVGTFNVTITATNIGGTDTETLVITSTGTQFAYEPFNYAAGNINTAADATGDFGFTGTTWTAGANKVITPGLSYSPLTVAGNTLQSVGNNVSDARTIDMTRVQGYTRVDTDSVTRMGKPGTSFWVRCIMRPDVDDSTNNLAATLAFLGAGSGGTQKLAVGVIGIGTGNYGVYKSTTSVAYGTVATTTGTPVLLVVHFIYGTGTNTDEADLYVNPPIAASPPSAPDAMVKSIGIGTIDRLSLGGKRVSSFDEIAMATDWNSLVLASTNGTLTFKNSPYSQVDGTSGTTPVTITVSRAGGTTGAVSAHYATSDGTAVAGTDYSAAKAPLNWPDGDSGDKTFTVSLVGNSVYGANKVFNVNLSTPTGGSSLGVAGSTVTIVNGATPPPPVAVDDYATVNRNTQVTGLVAMTNDYDPLGFSFSITSVGMPSHGTAFINPQNSWTMTYVPAAGFTGQDSFTYTITSANGSATATEHITVTAIKRLAIMPLGDSITVGTQNGQLTSFLGYRTRLLTDLNAANYPVQFDGSAPFYIGNDAGAGMSEGHSGYTIPEITSNLTANGGPSSNDGGYWLSGSVSTGRIAIAPDAITLEIGGNDAAGLPPVSTMQANLQALLNALKADLPNSQIFVSDLIPREDNANTEALQQQYNAQIPGMVTNMGSNFHYVELHTGFPSNGFDSTDLVHPNQTGYYFMADQWSAAIQTVFHPPVAANDSASTNANTPVTIPVLGNDSSPDGYTLSVSATGLPSHGGAVINGNNTVTYTPTAGYSGIDAFNYTIADTRGWVANATVSVTIASTGQSFASWAASHGLTGANANVSASPAHDGIANLIKYALGLDPNTMVSVHTNGTTPGLPWVFIQGSNLCMIYQKDTTKTDISYHPQVATALASWGSSGITETVQSTNGNIQTIQASVPLGSSTKQFLRLQITQP